MTRSLTISATVIAAVIAAVPKSAEARNDAVAAKRAGDAAAIQPARGAQATPSSSDAPAAEANDSGWEVVVEPYLWIPVIARGEVTIGDRTQSINADITDFVKVLEFVAAARATVWKGPVGLELNGAYLRVGNEFMNGTIHATGKESFGKALLGLRLWRRHAVSVQLYAGVRVTRLALDIDTPQQTLGASRWFTDFVGAVYLPIELSRSWELELRGEIEAPELAWTGAGIFHARVSSLLSILFGWQYSRLHKGEEDRSIKADVNGPYVGVEFHF